MSKLDAIKMQFDISAAHARHSEMHVATGFYKTKNLRKGGIDGTLCDERELLEMEIGVHINHIRIMSKCLEAYHDELEKDRLGGQMQS